MGFSWPRTIAITTAITLHAALFLWGSVAGVGERAEPPEDRTLIWDLAPPIHVELPEVPPSALPTPSTDRQPKRVAVLRTVSPGLIPGDGLTSAEPTRAITSSEWHETPAYTFGPANPLDYRPPLEYTPTRFAGSWVPEGNAIDELAHRYRAVALLRAAMGYRRLCTDEEKRQRLPRCFPPGAEPEGW